MLRYINADYSEFIQQVKLAQVGESDINVVRMFTAVKSAGGEISTESVYPCPATKLRLSSNHDYDTSVIREPNLLAGFPLLDPAAEEYEELVLDVEVWPPMAAWKLEASSNMELPSGYDDVVQYGCKTVPITVDLPETVGNERRWIKLVPADPESTAEPCQFVFYVRKASQTATLANAWLHWSFDTDTPLVDKRQGMLLSDPTNLTSAEDHISTIGAIKKALRCTDINGQKAAIMVDDVLYVRNNAYDSASKYGWKSPQENTAYRTDSTTPAAGASVYDTSDVLVEGSTVSQLTATHDNYWSSPELDIDFSRTSDHGFTLSMWSRRYSGGGLRAGIYDYNGGQVYGPLAISVSYDDIYIGIPDLNRTSIGFQNAPALRQAPTNANAFKHNAVSMSQAYTLDRDPYDPETGIGVKVWWEWTVIHPNGEWYETYMRSEEDDVGEWKAFKTDNAEAIANGAEIVWTDQDINSNWIKYSYTPGGEYVKKNNSNNYQTMKHNHGWAGFYYRPLNIAYEEKFWNKSSLSDLLTSFRYYTVYANGVRIYTCAYGIQNSLTSTPFKHFRIDLSSRDNAMASLANKTDVPMIDEIKIWKRMVTDEEMAIEAAAGGLYGVTVAESAPRAEETANEYVKPYSIAVGQEGNTYRRDPDLDGLINDNPKNPRYGWKRYTGSGPDQLWTNAVVPGVADPCYLEKYADTASVENSVLSLTELTKATIDYSDQLHMQLYVLDKQTLGVAVSFHDLIQRRLNEEYPYWTVHHYAYAQGHEAAWAAGWAKNGIIWNVMANYEPYLISQLDDDETWYFDGNNNVEILGRWFGSSGYFRTTCRQYHNVDKGSKWYIDPEDMPGMGNQPPIDGIQYAYLKLASPMTEGSTHTLSLLGNTVTFTYAVDQFNAPSGSIKINQEGYLPWASQRYAYLGQFMGSYGAFNPSITMTLSDGTNTSVYVKNYKKDVYDGADTKFAWDKVSGSVSFDTVYTTGSAPVLNDHVYTSSSSNAENSSLTITAVPTFSLVEVPIKYGAGVDSSLSNQLDRQHTAYTGNIIQVSAYKKTSADSGLRASDIYPSGFAGTSQPTDGECTYECDFTSFASCVKDKIIIGETAYFRDVIEDYVDYKITVGGAQYHRDSSQDTCNCYAWARESSGYAPELIYTKTDTDVSGRLMQSIPQAGDKASDTYEENGTKYDITAVTTPVLMQGWTTERVTESDWSDYTTVWTDSTSFHPSATATFEAGSEPTAINKAGSSLAIASYSKDAECSDISGYYAVYIPNIGWSYPFPIHIDSIGHMFWMYCRGMFNQRSGSWNHKRPYTNWEFQAGYPAFCYKGIFMPDDDAINKTTVCWQVDPVTQQDVLSASNSKIGIDEHFAENTQNSKIDTPLLRDVYGGWWDAADFDMRINHLRCVDDFAKTFLYFPENFGDSQLNLPESGDGIPDVLNEAMWGLDLYRKAQLPDGGICGWFETYAHQSGEPDYCVKEAPGCKYYSCIPNRFISAIYVIPACHLARSLWYVADHTSDTTLKAKANALGDMYFDSASAAFHYAIKDIDPTTLEYTKPQQPVVYSIGTKAVKYLEPYDDSLVGDSKRLRQLAYIGAAAAIYAITRENFPKGFLTTEHALFHATERHTGESYPWMSWDICLDCDDLPEVSSVYRQKVVSLANSFADAGPVRNAYRGITRDPESDYWFRAVGWGHVHPEFRGSIFPLAYKITGDEKYRKLIFNGLSFVTGCNCTGMTWTTGLGRVYPVRNMSHNGTKLQSNQIFSTDPGISQYFYNSFAGLTWAQIGYSVYLNAPARTDVGFAGVDFSRMPAKMAELGAVGSVVEAGPCWRYIAYLQESNSVAMSEYTVWETMSGKINLAGVFLNKNWKPRPWYKQCRPAKSLFEDRCFMPLL